MAMADHLERLEDDRARKEPVSFDSAYSELAASLSAFMRMNIEHPWKKRSVVVFLETHPKLELIADGEWVNVSATYAAIDFRLRGVCEINGCPVVDAQHLYGDVYLCTVIDRRGSCRQMLRFDFDLTKQRVVSKMRVVGEVESPAFEINGPAFEFVYPTLWERIMADNPSVT